MKKKKKSLNLRNLRKKIIVNVKNQKKPKQTNGNILQNRGKHLLYTESHKPPFKKQKVIK
jgi:hypothetical protein